MNVSIIKKNGVNQIEIDGQLYLPLSFRSFRPEERNIQEFYASGVQLMSVLMTGIDCTLDVPYSLYGEIWVGKKQYNFNAIDLQMELFIKNAPDAYFNIMLQFDTRKWYLEQNPECSNTFYNLVEMASYEKWRQDVCEYLADIVGYLEEKYGNKIFSYSMLCGSSTEWYTNSQGNGKPESKIRYHLLKEKAFQQYTCNSNAVLPSMEQLTHITKGIFRDSTVDREAIEYWHFHHGVIGETIIYFASYLKNLLNRKKLIGIYYGYIFPLPDTRLLYEGQMGYEKVWACPDIDLMYEPASYRDRHFEGTSGFLNNVDSIHLHNKLQFHEIDHTTYIAPTHVENGRSIPGSDSRLKNSFDTRMVLRREYSMCMAKRVGMWWFDFFGGYYYASELMEEVKNIVSIRERLREIPMKSVSEIAVVSDVESMYYVSEFAKINNDCLTNICNHLGRMGAPYDTYNFSDLSILDTSPYKFFIMLNVFYMTKEQRKLVEEKIKTSGKSVLWIYAPAYISEDGFSIKNMQEITDIILGETTLKTPQISYENMQYGFQENIRPMFAVNDAQAEIWGRYTENNKGALACKKLESYTSYYSGTGNIHYCILQRIAKAAGIHIYYEGADPIYANDRLIGIHSVCGGLVTLNLREDSDVEELFDGGHYHSQDKKLTVEIPKGEMKLFLLK